MKRAKTTKDERSPRDYEVPKSTSTTKRVAITPDGCYAARILLPEYEGNEDDG